MPNIFWRGYSPELITIKDAKSAKVMGVLGDYHNGIVLKSFQEGLSVADTVKKFADLDYYTNKYGHVASASINELKAREKDLDVKISDLIEQDFQRTRLFHTFNHPCSKMLLAQARRVLEILEMPVTVNINFSYIPDFLATFIPALMPATVSHLDLDFEAPEAFRGYGATSGGSIEKKWVYINATNYVEKSFLCYNNRYNIFSTAKIDDKNFNAKLPAALDN